MATKPSHLQIIGVRHNDRRVPDLVQEELELPVDEMFHETPEEDTQFLRYALWTILRNPLAVVMGALRVLFALMENLRFVLGMAWKGKANQLTLQSDGLVQGRRAANEIEKEHGIGWTPIGMNRVERVRILPFGISILSWLTVASFLLAIYSLIIAPVLGVLFVFTSLGTAVGVSWLIGDIRRPSRDERMFENILDACEEDDQVAVFVGENHVKGISCHATSAGIEFDTSWVSSTADIRGE